MGPARGTIALTSAHPEAPASLPSSDHPADGSSADRHADYMATRQFASLDGVRCLCILAVIWHHSLTRPFQGLASRGFLGVDMFFVLSGFLIVTLLLRERRGTGDISLKNFYARRTLRIFPAYYFLIFATLAALLVAKPGSEMTRGLIRSLPFLVTFTSNWVEVSAVNLGILWSLATEEQFYLAWPAIEKYLKPRAVLAVLAVVIIANQLINFRCLDGLIRAIAGDGYTREILQTTFTPIALGVLLSHVLDDRRAFLAAYRLTGWPGAPLAFASALLLMIALAPQNIGGWPRLAIQCLMALLLASLVVREDHLARPFLSWRPVRAIGLVSYGMYLYHMWAIHVARVITGKLGFDSTPACFATAAILTAIVAAISFRFLEMPALRLKRYFGGAVGARPTPGKAHA